MQCLYYFLLHPNLSTPFWEFSVLKVYSGVNHIYEVKMIVDQGKLYFIEEKNIWALFRNKQKYNYANHMQIMLMNISGWYQKKCIYISLW